MSWFNDLKIAKKVMFFAIVTVVFIFTVGTIGYICNNNANASMKEMYESKLASLQAIQSIQNNFNAIKTDVYQLMQNTDARTNQKLKADIESRQKENSGFVKDFENASPDSFEKEQMNNLKEVIPQFRVVVKASTDLAVKNKNAEAYKLMASNENISIEVRNIIRKIVKHDKDTSKKLYEQNKQSSETANTIIIFVILLSVAIASIFSGWMVKMLDRRFKVLVNLANDLAEGDMTVNAKILSKDEIGETGTAINNAASKLRVLIKDVTTSIQDISASSEEMSASADQTAQGAQQTANSTQQLAQGSQQIANNIQDGAKTVETVNKNIQTIAKESDMVSQLGDTAETTAKNGTEYVKKAVSKINNIKTVSGDISETIEKLGTLSSEIETIVDLIKGIAGQTNLLALNAAIEAARAGEHGKGFAVVADEVKKLAGDSADATEKITEMIKEIQSKTHDAVNKMDKATSEVEEGVTVVNEVGDALGNIISQVGEVNGKVQDITKQVDIVAGGSEDLVKMIEDISAITEETAASAEEISSITEEQTASMEEISASSQTLAKVAENLNHQVSVFKV